MFETEFRTELSTTKPPPESGGFVPRSEDVKWPEKPCVPHCPRTGTGKLNPRVFHMQEPLDWRTRQLLPGFFHELIRQITCASGQVDYTMPEYSTLRTQQLLRCKRRQARCAANSAR